VTACHRKYRKKHHDSKEPDHLDQVIRLSLMTIRLAVAMIKLSLVILLVVVHWHWTTTVL
jgi:hypothetical protein